MILFRRFLLLMALWLVTLAGAAPLFPDVSSKHWAADAVAALAAKGLVEGYPDGTFKGDRAASRWETALIVARLLRKLETEHATFATRAELEEVRQLATALREELDALGVRVTNLETGVEQLDKRVSELERITFYGSLDARIVSQSFRNLGATDNDSQRGGAGLPGGVPYINYDATVGTAAPGLFLPAVQGVLPVVDYVQGRVLNSGTGFTTRALLGTKIDVSDDIKAGLELVGYTSQGDLFVDGYWGLNAPFTAHVGSGNVGGGGSQPLNHQPFSRMVFDRFWLEHKPSKVKVTVGSLGKLKINPLIYAGQANASLDGPRRLNFGFSVVGESKLSSDSWLDWEVFQSRLGSRNVFQGTNYAHDTWGADIAYKFDQGAGSVQLNFARFFDEAIGGATLQPGLLGFNNVPYGASGGWSAFQWVNPPGHFALQRPLQEQQNTGLGFLGTNTVDTRPISGWNGSLDHAIGLPAGGGNYGPQSQNTYGIVANYRWDLDSKDSVGVEFDYARTDYKSNRNSSYTSEGDALRVVVDGRHFGGSLDWDVSYLSVDARYGPARFRNGLIGARFPAAFNVVGAFHPHDINTYLHNREGFRAGTKFRYNENRGLVWFKGAWLRQKETSLYDVRATPNALGLGVPNFPVIGFAPGFVDNYFPGYAHPNIYGPNSGNSFTAGLAPLEDPRGTHNRWELGASYKWDEPAIDLRASYRKVDVVRRSGLSPQLGGSQNHIDVDTHYIRLESGWDMTKSHRLSAGFDLTQVEGHYDPAGLYNAYADRIASNDFTNIDSTQFAPFVSFDWSIDEKTDWTITARHFDTADHVDPSVTAGRAFDTIGSSAHPFEWGGWQVWSQFSLKF